MADTEEGFTRLANALYEELIGASLTRNQAKVAHAVCRKTCGFNKSMDRIADSQISQLTGLPRQKVNKAKNELIQMGVLIREGTMIGPNKHLSQWQIPGCHREGVAVTKSATALSPKQRHTKDTVTKDNNSASENCVESPDTSSATLSASRPEAAVRTPRGTSGEPKRISKQPGGCSAGCRLSLRMPGSLPGPPGQTTSDCCARPCRLRTAISVRYFSGPAAIASGSQTCSALRSCGKSGTH